MFNIQQVYEKSEYTLTFTYIKTNIPIQKGDINQFFDAICHKKNQVKQNTECVILKND